LTSAQLNIAQMSNNMRINIQIILLLFLNQLAMGQLVAPAPPQSTPILLTGATAHLGDGTIIEDAAIGFSMGKITIVSTRKETRRHAGYDVIDVTGQHIYPGFILPNSTLGLEEVSSVRASRDEHEVGTLNPNVRSLISYNTDSENIPTFRFNGVLLAETTPQGGLISGTSSVMELEGWNWEDAVHTKDMGIHMHWPGRTVRNYDVNTFTITTSKNPRYDAQVASIKKLFLDARAYEQTSQPARNLKLEAVLDLFNGSKRLFIHAGGANEIIESIRLAQESGVQTIVLHTSHAALKVSSFLVDHKIPVIIPATHTLPAKADDPIDLPYELPALLTRAGLSVSLSDDNRFLTNGRNLPFYAGTAAAYGLGKEEALKTITSNPASALGISDRVGTLEVGKDATLFVSIGDALDIRGNILTNAFISGKQIELDNKQQELYKRFSEKYGQSVTE